jgi:hypothetical protein
MKLHFPLRIITLVSMLVFMLMPTPNFGAMSAKQHPCLQAEKQVGIAPGIQSELRKIGFFKKISKIKQIKKSLKKRLTMEREKASTMAKLALYLFLGSIGLAILNSAAAMSTAIISAIVSLAFLASIVLSFIVLFGDENKKSKAIAKTVLIVAGLMVLITLILFVAVIVAFAAW